MIKYKIIIERDSNPNDSAVLMTQTLLKVGDSVGFDLRDGFKYEVTNITEMEGKTPIARVK